MAGAGSLGTFLSGAARELVTAIRAHNVALAEGAPNDDPRYIHAEWGHVVVDAIAGSSAGALTSSQIAKCLFEPGYAGAGGPIDAPNTVAGDWIHGGDFTDLSVDGNTPTAAGPIEAPGWTLMSAARLYELAERALHFGGAAAPDDGSPLDWTGTVGVGITLTDLLGYHDPAEFAPDRVLGHPEFGCGPVGPSRLASTRGHEVRDLGGKGHAEIRKLFLSRSELSAGTVRDFLSTTQRRGRARVLPWGQAAAERLATLCAASASLPLALGPVAVTDRAGESDTTYRRLYMDGGILNNKPVAPALRLARWHDAIRLLHRRDEATGEFSPDVVREELVYERVCFFLDAFPDRVLDEWRSAHPDRVFDDLGNYQLTAVAHAAREERIDESLARPTSGLGVFFESIMTSLRAQDMRTIAKTNARLRNRDRFIERLCTGPPLDAGDFRIDTIERAQAYAAVVGHPAGADLPHEQALGVAALVWESDRASALAGRRSVTMIPLFAPQDLVAVFAGEALYAMGGLLAIEARRHDAAVGSQVARRVLAAIGDDAPPPSRLAPAPAESLPDDTAPLVERLRVAAEALIDGRRNPRTSALRFFARLPLQVEPIVRVAKRHLDRMVLGLPPEDG